MALLLSFFLVRWYWVLLAGLLTAVPSSADPSSPQHSLTPLLYTPLPLGTIKPLGWLRSELESMASGLAGHEADFYRFVTHSTWLGGDQEYSGLNEAFPYWFNGLVPLAYGLDDERLKGQVRDAVRAALARQQSDGWIGPETGAARNFWARYPFFLGCIQLCEAEPAMRAEVLPPLHRFVKLMNSMLHDGGAGYLLKSGDTLSEEDHGWGRVRVADMMITLIWLLENDPAGQEGILFENLEMLREGAIDWAAWYQEGVYIKEDLNSVPLEYTRANFPYEHGVNVGQGLKTGAVINRFSPNTTQLTTARRAVDWTFTHHGSSSGTILADERLQGLGPYYGSELCTTVETIYSLTYLYHALGDPSLADRAEKAAFNALPAALTPDHWGHQYVSLPNQAWAADLRAYSPTGETPYWNVNPLGNIYGLEPNYPCCTVNHPQGYPKFLAGSWARMEGGFAHTLLGPSRLEVDGMSVECVTDYPFSDVLTYTVNASSPLILHLRIPTWSTSASITSGSDLTRVSPEANGLHTLTLPSGSSTFTLHLSRSLTLEPRANNTIALHHGPLLYALSIKPLVTVSPHRDSSQGAAAGGQPVLVRDWSITNGSAWNVAVDPSTFVYKERGGGPSLPVWGPGGPPGYIEGRGCKIEWDVWKGVPGPVPLGRKCLGESFGVRFVPVGSMPVWMAEVPVVDLSGGDGGGDEDERH
ncbi:hypothetical protein EJ06DRAFT_532901 [Trichodelitschia bisporula]|uniref:DUF1680-domain-containing protein n=1 Tax=Trichodelitschia bisporula TaxID=703511 RepID=A0A6G1HPS0_9PEZI|nr:hypothetical protein EJ06DRAFT_532901 [Trichodelitschia bisporula]